MITADIWHFPVLLYHSYLSSRMGNENRNEEVLINNRHRMIKKSVSVNSRVFLATTDPIDN